LEKNEKQKALDRIKFLKRRPRRGSKCENYEQNRKITTIPVVKG
jgi:hypothetical protein